MSLEKFLTYAGLRHPVIGAPSQDQVNSAVDSYLTRHPVEPGATEAEAAQIEANRVAIEGKQDKGNYVKTVNGATPDANGNIVVATGGGGSSDSGQNVELDTTLTQSGKAADAGAVGAALDELEAKIPDPGAKNYGDLSGKPSINGVTLDGNKTSEELGITGITDEQVRTAVDGYIADNPGAISPGATPEQVAQIEFANATDAALFATLETGSLYEINLSGCTFTNNIGYQYIDGTKVANVGDDRFRRLDRGYIHLQAGDVLVTNADTFADPSQYDGSGYWPKGTVGSLVWRNAGTEYPNNGYVSACMFGLGKFDGLYRVYEATETDEYLQVAYRVDGIEYTPRFFVARSRTGAMPVALEYSNGYIKADTYEVRIQSETEQFATGFNGEVVSNLITISAPGKFLLVRNVKMVQTRGKYCWVRYDESGAMIDYMDANIWGSEKDYFVVPLVNATEYIRLNWLNKLIPWHMAEAMIVDKGYLIRNGYADHMAGMSIAMFGDSYVKGDGVGPKNSWHGRFASNHQMFYTNCGHSGYGLAASPNINEGLIDICTEIPDVDYIGVICGRNDSTAGVAIGTNDDLSTPETARAERTFKGALNYLCSYLINNHPAKKVFFVTPWLFPERDSDVAKPEEYLDAVLEITARHGIPCLDARRSGIHVRSEAFRAAYFNSATDVSHLNGAGHALMESNAAGWMLAL